jgi:hypothetical protein
LCAYKLTSGGPGCARAQLAEQTEPTRERERALSSSEPKRAPSPREPEPEKAQSPKEPERKRAHEPERGALDNDFDRPGKLGIPGERLVDVDGLPRDADADFGDCILRVYPLEKPALCRG